MANMTTYAKAVNGQEVAHFEDASESPGDGFIEVLSGWPAPRPDAHSRPFILDGVVRWDDPRDLVELKAQKNAVINAARMTANFTFFTYAGKQIACDVLSRSDIDGVNGYIANAGAFRAGWKGAWKAMDNSYVPITTVDDWKALYAAMIDQGQANFDHAQSLKAALSSATTNAEVDAINW